MPAAGALQGCSQPLLAEVAVASPLSPPALRLTTTTFAVRIFCGGECDDDFTVAGDMCSPLPTPAHLRNTLIAFKI